MERGTPPFWMRNGRGKKQVVVSPCSLIFQVLNPIFESFALGLPETSNNRILRDNIVSKELTGEGDLLPVTWLLEDLVT